MFNLSSAMAARWAEFSNEFTETVRALGPSPIRMALLNAGKGGTQS
jgi:coenzyme F420-reducing hydrogenase delta subunit